MNRSAFSHHAMHARKGPARPPLLKKKKETRTRQTEKHIDKTLEHTFPASDPPAVGGITRIDPSERPDENTHSSRVESSSSKEAARHASLQAQRK